MQHAQGQLQCHFWYTRPVPLEGSYHLLMMNGSAERLALACAMAVFVGLLYKQMRRRVPGQLVLWGHANFRSGAVIWLLEELGVPYKHRPIASRTPAMDMPEFVALSPRRKIPVLQDDHFTLTETAAINTYLCDRYPRPLTLATYPGIPRRRGIPPANVGSWVDLVAGLPSLEGCEWFCCGRTSQCVGGGGGGW